MSERRDLEILQQERDHCKGRLDELAGENFRLEYTISGLRVALQQKRKGFALLSELQQSIGAHQQISSIYETMMGAINATLGMDRTVVLTPMEGADDYRPSHWLGFRGEAVSTFGGITLTFPPELAGRGGLLLVNKATETTPLIQTLRDAFGLPYFICVPVIGEQDKPLGMLLTGRLTEAKPIYPPLDQGDVDTLQAIAGLIAAVVRNMRVAVLEEMDRLKTDFFANVSHEFRTPIALTIGPLDQLIAGRYGPVPPAVAEQLTVMRRNQERLLLLIDQILDLAKLEAGGMELRVSPVPDMNRFVEERVRQFRTVAEKRGLDLRISLDPRVAEAEILIDRDKFDKLLSNLLSNALKYTHEGSVGVSTEIRDRAFHLSVTDTGIGIREDELPYIFDRFRQVGGNESVERAGTGIGLALVREVTKLLGGQITVQSQFGQGTSFRVALPLGRTHFSPSSVVDLLEDDLMTGPGEAVLDANSVGAPDRNAVEDLNHRAEAEFDPGKHTLVYAEDNRELRSHVRDLLAGEFNLFLAVDGMDGLEKVRQYRPDLVISDQMMPKMSGREMLHAIREDPEMRLTPVIFLTARVGTEARIASLEAGADDYLTKPFHEGELVARIRNLIRAREQERQLAELNRRLEARVEQQVAELVRSGELKRFLPPTVAESVLSGRITAADDFERRKITILSAELDGLAALTEGLEPEELSSVVNDYLRELTAVAIAHGGTIEPTAGQRFTVLFGAPTDMEVEDQAWAAVQAATEMRSRLNELLGSWRRRGIAGVPSIRIGINAGYCTVGLYGSDAFRSYAAVGAPVTTAALLQEEAKPGEILCTFAAYALILERVKATPRGDLTLASGARPTETFEILGLADSGDESESTATIDPVFLPK